MMMGFIRRLNWLRVLDKTLLAFGFVGLLALFSI